MTTDGKFDAKFSDEGKLAQKTETFEKFLDLQTTKFILSFIPEGKETDAVRTALRSAFDAGYDCGGGACAADFIHTMLKIGDRKRP